MGEVPGPGNDFSDALLRLVNDVNVNIEGGDILLSEAWELGSGCCGDNVVVRCCGRSGKLWSIKGTGVFVICPWGTDVSWESWGESLVFVGTSDLFVIFHLM